MARAERVVLPISTGSVTTYLFSPLMGEASETVLVVHGWGGRSEHMLPLIEELRTSGRRVVALDLPGHGASSGRVLDLARAVQAVDAAWRQFGPFDLMVGHSFGGAVVTHAAGGTVCGVPKRQPRQIVTISSPNSLPAVFDRFSEWIGLTLRARAALLRQVERIAGKPVDVLVSDRVLKRLRLPTLVIHAHDDKEVSAENAYAMTAAGPHVEIVWADGFGHRRILSASEVSQAVVAFADKHALHGPEEEPQPFHFDIASHKPVVSS